MKILTAAEMREVDRLTIERGIPGLILMENAGSRVVDFLRETFAPLNQQRVAIICGKGNNAGDGFVVARQLFTRKLCRNLNVIELFDPETLSGNALANRKMLDVCGCPVSRDFKNEANLASIVVDAVLGTGLRGPAKGPSLEGIRMINERFPLAKKVAIDIPSGLSSDETNPTGEFVRADYTVTFTAPKRSQCLSPSYEHMGKLIVVAIGSPSELYETNPNIRLNLTTAENIRPLFARRPRNSNKGMYGHVLVIGGSFGKSGAPAMAGLGSYRSGAGLVTVAVPSVALPTVASYRPELMTEPLERPLAELLKGMTVLAVGPGLGTAYETVRFVKQLYKEADLPAVVDADALNALAGALPHTDKVRILTPHPGEMGRLIGKSAKDVQDDRLGTARGLGQESGATIVLKGDRTIIAFPDGETWVNPTGCPAMATGGTGDVLTGMIAGMIAQHPNDWKRAVVAAVWLHGRAGELAAGLWGEEAMLATDLLKYLPAAMNEVRASV
ncbi:MAG: NAD(P)H-hydrate dehydratase [Acidobacteriaceae bacterium]|nr:NAD(P)H-hydrate dehydratase [Acidobacteriaceae bacterium]MBV9779294.1 NAD(P)H-hydrate dehydratase [Acidobacteriaceae bacterium]